MGVDDGVQRASFAVVLGLPGADWASALEAGEDAFGSQLAETVGGEAARRRGGERMDLAGAGAKNGVSRPL